MELLSAVAGREHFVSMVLTVVLNRMESSFCPKRLFDIANGRLARTISRLREYFQMDPMGDVGMRETIGANTICNFL